MTDSHDQLASSLGRISSGLYIATATLDGQPIGMLASFIEQAGFDPPMVSIAVQPGRALARALEAGSPVGINIIGESGGTLMKPFLKPDEPSPFEGVAMTLEAGGIPRLHDAVAFLLGEVRGRLEAGDHSLFLCEITAGHLHDPETKPMVRFRRDGLSY